MIFFWPSASGTSELAKDVHVWVWEVPSETDRDAANVAILSPDERDRMSRFLSPQDRRRYLTSHASLRRLLSGYVGCAPRDLGFEAGEFGKPALKIPSGSEAIRFSLSHSGDVGLVAVTRAGEIGADVERIRAIEPEVAESHFSRRELADLKSLDESRWLAGFYNCWTRKEAILKAEGRGFNLPLDGFDVSLLPGDPAALLEVRPEAQMSHNWKLLHMQPATDMVGAIAIGGSVAVKCFHFED
jgi:4'-phosphopantetheinyl transferase